MSRFFRRLDRPPQLSVVIVEAFVGGSVYWLVWCKHCRKWHRHGPAEGHRESHCNDPDSPYWRTGYNLAYAGTWTAGMDSASE